MNVRYAELLTAFSSHGFSLLRRDETSRSLVVGKPSAHESLYEDIIVHTVGKSGDAVIGEVGVSTVRHLAMGKDLIEREVVALEGCDPERLWTIIKTPDAARSWERRFASVAPERCPEIVERLGPDLLRRTQKARDNVGHSLADLTSHTSFHEMETWLGSNTSTTQKAEAERILRGIMLAFPGGGNMYHTAILVFVIMNRSWRTAINQGAGTLPLNRISRTRPDIVVVQKLSNGRFRVSAYEVVLRPTRNKTRRRKRWRVDGTRFSVKTRDLCVATW